MPKFYKLLVPLEDTKDNPLTRDRIMKWLADSKWVEGRIRKMISPMDKMYYEDYCQECWIQILEVPSDKILEIYRKGKGKFVNYIKSIILNNIRSSSSHLYKNIRMDRKNEVYLDDQEWSDLENGIENTTADTIWPEKNYNNDIFNRVIIRTEKEQIKSDDELIYESEDIEEQEG